MTVVDPIAWRKLRAKQQELKEARDRAARWSTHPVAHFLSLAFVYQIEKEVEALSDARMESAG